MLLVTNHVVIVINICRQDALSDATNTEKGESEKEGIKFFNYKIDSPVSCHCHVTVYVTYK